MKTTEIRFEIKFNVEWYNANCQIFFLVGFLHMLGFISGFKLDSKTSLFGYDLKKKKKGSIE